MSTPKLVVTMSAKTRQALIVVAVVLLALKFRNQLVDLIARVPVVGPLIV